MPAWNRNEPIAEKRRVLIGIDDIDGAPAPASTLFDGDGELLVDQGDGHYVPTMSTLANTDRPLTFADKSIAGTSTVADTLTVNAHGLSTGDGPVQIAAPGGSPPGGTALATDYWIIKVDANTIQVAETLADALAGVAVDLTSAAIDAFIVDTANTKRLNDGLWMLEVPQDELGYRGTYFGIRISKPGVIRDVRFNVDLRDEQQLHAGTAQAGAAGAITLDPGASATNDLYKDAVCLIVGGMGAGQANTIASYAGGTKIATMARNWAIVPDATSQFVIVPAPSGANPTSVADAVWGKVLEGAHTAADLVRLAIGILAGAVADYSTGTYAYKSLNGAKTRSTHTADETGRGNPVIGDLT